MTVTNTNELPATVVWCAKGGTDFADDGTMNLGEVSTLLAPGQTIVAGPFGTEISYLVVYDVTLDPGPDPVDITLVKEWFDPEGAPATAPEDGWGVEMTSGEMVLASVPGDDDTATFGWTYDAESATWVPGSYDVTETGLPEGFEEVDCAEVSDTTATATGTGTAFAAAAGGLHLVCNQELPDDVEPEVFELTIAKVWLDDEGTVIEEPEDVDWAVTLTIDDEVVASLPGEDDTHTSTEPIDGYSVEEDLPLGWEVVDCPEDVLADAGAGADGTGEFEGDADGLHLVCNAADVDVLPIVIPTPDDDGDDDAEVEVLAEVVSRSSTLPATGGPVTGLLPLALVLLAMGVSLVLNTRRHRGGSSLPS